MCLLYASTYLNDGVLVEVGDAELGAGGHVGVGTELEDAGLMRRWVGMVEYIRRAAVVEEGRSDEDRTARGRLRVPGRHVEAVSEEAEVRGCDICIYIDRIRRICSAKAQRISCILYLCWYRSVIVPAVADEDVGALVHRVALEAEVDPHLRDVVADPVLERFDHRLL